MTEMIGNRYLAQIDAARRLEKHYRALICIGTRKAPDLSAPAGMQRSQLATPSPDLAVHNRRLTGALDEIDRKPGRYNLLRVRGETLRVDGGDFARRRERSIREGNARLADSLSRVRSHFSVAEWRKHSERTEELIHSMRQNSRRLNPLV